MAKNCCDDSLDNDVRDATAGGNRGHNVFWNPSLFRDVVCLVNEPVADPGIGSFWDITRGRDALSLKVEPGTSRCNPGVRGILGVEGDGGASSTTDGRVGVKYPLRERNLDAGREKSNTKFEVLDLGVSGPNLKAFCSNIFGVLSPHAIWIVLAFSSAKILQAIPKAS